MSSELQKEVGNQAIQSGLMKPYDIIDYTYSNARLEEIKSGKIHTKNSENNQIANTLTTNAENMGVCVPNNTGVVNPLKGKTQYGWHFEQQVYDENGITRTIKAGGGSGNIPKVIEGKIEVLGNHSPSYEPSLRIRKLTPKECWRLMGFDDEDFAKAEKVNSNSQLYKQAGNSIVVNVLMAIFKELFVTKQTRSEWLDELLS